MCINPYQGIAMFCLLLFSPTSKKGLCKALGRDKQDSTLVLHMLYSQIEDPRKLRSAILLDQDVHVCGKR
jgi:hypothetical protein